MGVSVTAVDGSAGLTAPVTKENGERTAHLASENLPTLTVTCMRVHGLTTKLMVAVSTYIQMALATMVNGKMISSRVVGRRPGTTGVFIPASTLEARNTAVESTHGTMGVASTVNGLKTRLKALERIRGLMDDSTEVNGTTTTWKAWVCMSGRTDASMRASMPTTRNMALGFTPGLMEECTQETGRAESSTASACTLCRAPNRNLASGKKANALSGLTPSSSD